MKASHIAIGEIAKPQGIRGEVKIRPMTNDPYRFEDLTRVYFKKGEEHAPVSLTVTRISGDAVFAVFEGVTDRDAAEKLRGETLWVERGDAVELSGDENFICELEGLEGFDDEGGALGRLTEVMQPGGNDVYVFKGARGEILVPALKSVVKSVDIDAGKIVLYASRLAEVAVFDED